jgi:phospholipase/carboxylesterase
MKPTALRGAVARGATGLWLAVVVLIAGACDPSAATQNTPTEEDSTATSGRLSARPAAATQSVNKGLQVLRITPEGRPFGVYVPSNYDPAQQWPVAILLHGLGGSGEGMALEFSEFAEAAGLVVIAPNSASQTWDLLYTSRVNGRARFGPDRAHIDALLEWTFDHVSVDPARIGLAGFDDGATYALWLGLKNGDLFTRLGAYSPCSNIPNTRTGMPVLFVSHGVDDQVAPIDDCSRNMVPRLTGAGYTVDFVEYASVGGNGHFMTDAVMAEAMMFLARPD